MGMSGFIINKHNYFFGGGRGGGERGKGGLSEVWGVFIFSWCEIVLILIVRIWLWMKILRPYLFCLV